MSHPRRQRGAATVEMAISLIALVPIILYTVFLQDLLRYKLDLQEAIVSSPWDFAVLDYSKKAPPLDKIQHNARLMFCDHSSAYDSFKQEYDCKEENHHRPSFAHICWLTEGGEQVTCDKPEDVGFKGTDTAASSFASTYTTGGMIACHGRVAVLNYFLPQKLFSQFSHVNMTDRKEYSGGVHGNAVDPSGVKASEADVYLLTSQKFSLVTDTWAMNASPDVKPGDKSGDLYDRVNTVYQKNLGYLAVLGGTVPFLLKTGQNDLLMPALPLIGGDNPLTPNIASLHGTNARPPPSTISQEGSGTDYDATPWKDWDQDMPKRTWENRGGYYMGHTASESN